MRSISFPTAAGCLLALIAPRLCAAGRHPQMQFDPDTIDTCIGWIDNYKDQTCEYIRDYFNITPEEFHLWNPSISVDCEGWWPQSYCVIIDEKLPAETTTTTELTTTTSTTSTLGPSPTSWNALGCYLDGTPPTLSERVSQEGGDEALTVLDCENDCYLSNLSFAGVKEGNQCWCGDYVGNEKSKNSTDCNMPCSGNKTEMCGAEERINVFKAVF